MWKYEKIVEHPRTINFRSQNEHLFIPRCAAQLDPSTVPFPLHQISNAKIPVFQFQTSPLLPYPVILLAHQQTVFETLCSFNNSDIDSSPDEVLDSELSPTNFSQPSFQLITPPVPDEPYLSSSLHTDTTPILPLCQVTSPIYPALTPMNKLSMS